MAKNLINGYLMGLENKRRKNMKDLHLHTNISDGKNTPMEMINKLIELGVNEASITDHDAFDSYLVIPDVLLCVFIFLSIFFLLIFNFLL